MRKSFRFFPLIVILTLLMCMASAAFAQEDMRAVNDSAFAQRVRPPAVFNHDEHNGAAGIEDCAVCHHVYKNDKLVKGDSSEGTPCSECHVRTKDPRHLDLVVAFHKCCIGCHEKEKKGPVVCCGCHKK